MPWVSWPAGAGRPTTKHGHEDTCRGTGWGALWGLLFGTLFAVPVLGVAVGAEGGALAKVKEGLGITDQQLGRISERDHRRNSARFLVTDRHALDRLGERMRGLHAGSWTPTSPRSSAVC